MQLTRQQVMSWAPSDILEAGIKFQSSGAVQGIQAKNNLLAGSLKLGATRFVVRMRLGDGKPHVECPCAVAQRGGVCAHAVAVALHRLQQHGGETPENDLVFSSERAPTREEILKWAGPALVERAERRIRAGEVSRIAFTYPVGQGSVLSNGAPLPVTFRMLENGLAEGKCPCYVSRDQGMLCEHVVAVMLAVMLHYGSPERRAQCARERAHAARMAQATGMLKRAPNGLPAEVRVLLPADVPAQFARGTVRIGIVVLADRRPVPLGQPTGQCYRFSPSDENLLDILEDIAGGPFGSTLQLSRSDFLAILRCGITGWIGWIATKKRLPVLADPLETPILLTADPDDDSLRLAIQTPPEGSLLIEGTQGFWLTPAEARPLRRVLPGPLQTLYAQPERIGRELISDFFSRELPLLRAALPLAEESVTPDLFTVTPGTPLFRLELAGSQASVAAKLRAAYGNIWVTVGVPSEISLPDRDDFYHCFGRNLPVEKAALERMHRIGFYGSRGDDLGSITGVRAVLNFLGEQVTALRRDGWQVDISGSLESFFDEAEVILPVVSVTEDPATGSFDVSTRYISTRETVEVTPAEIERALACGNAYFEKEGKTVLLDIGAIRTVRETLNSCGARAGTRPGSSRVEAIHSAYVQSALETLEGIDFEASPDWRSRASVQNRARRLEPVDLGRLEGTLRPYQKEGVYWLRFLETCGFCGILADEMGLGKTLQTLTWLHLPRCREEARRVPALIVCPTSLVENWRREAEKFVPWMRCLVISGPDRARLFAQVPRSDLVITSYALIRRDVEFYSQYRFSVAVLDEAQAIKNQKTQNAVAVKQIVADTRLVLSGTPIENGVSDLWSIMDFLMPKYLGAYDDFKLAYEDVIEVGGAEAERAQMRLRRKLHPFLLRRIKKDVAKDLPDKIRSVTYCVLSPDQRKLYDTIRNEVREKMRGLVREKGFEKSRFEVLALLMRLRQICCDLRLVKDRVPAPQELSSAKLDALMELLDEARAGGHRMLVFSQFTSMLKLIADRLETEKLAYCYLDGATKDRLGECARFNQHPEIPVFLISLKAGGTGLNLTGADMVVHFDPWWNPAAEEQATDRAHRIGQKKTVHAIKLIAQDTIEEKVLEMQKRKQALIEATVNASDSSIASSLTFAEIESLLQ